MIQLATATSATATSVRSTATTVTERRKILANTADKKKSAPGGTQFPNQDYRTIPGGKSQWLAEFLLERIGDREHPLKRPKNASVDRVLRGLIAEKNAAGEDIIINNGEGYYRAGPDDRPAVFEYWIKETHRAKEIKNKADTMMATYTSIYGRYE